MQRICRQQSGCGWIRRIGFGCCRQQWRLGIALRPDTRGLGQADGRYPRIICGGIIRAGIIGEKIIGGLLSAKQQADRRIRFGVDRIAKMPGLWIYPLRVGGSVPGLARLR